MSVGIEAAVFLLDTKVVQNVANLILEIHDMPPLVDTKDAGVVEEEVQTAYQIMFPGGQWEFVATAFRWALDAFQGRTPGYLPIDARYHDLEHTLQGVTCMVNILQSRHAAAARPEITRRDFELGLCAILLHDTGYLKRTDDSAGTGAKYTLIHVKRSMDFAAQMLRLHGFTSDEIKSVQHMISCTGVNVDLRSIPFQTESERMVGFALGTGDLLGQMAADDYVDKLPILFEEFAEAQQFSGGMGGSRIGFSTAEDLMQKTPAFWNSYVRPKIEVDFQGMYKFLNDPYPNGANIYIDRIEVNIRKLQEITSYQARQ